MKKVDPNQEQNKANHGLSNVDGGITALHVLNVLDDGVIWIDRDWKYRFVNDAYLKMKSLIREDIINQSVWDLHPELIGTKFEDIYTKAMASNAPYEYEDYYPPLKAWFNVRINPIEDGLTVFYKNIYQRKLAENEQQLSEAIIESSLDAIVTIDLAGNLTSWNKGAEKMLGYTEEEVLGKPLPKMKLGMQMEEDELVKKVLLSGVPHESYEERRRAKNGDILYLSVSAYPIKNTLGEIVGVSAIGRDITELRKTNLNLKKSQRLYSFLSAINQSIVQIKSEDELLENACKVALEQGGYLLAWIGILDESGKLQVDNLHGSKLIKEKMEQIPKLDYSAPPLANTPTGKALKTGQYAMCNDLQNDPDMAPWKADFVQNGIHSSIIFPIKKFGKTVGVFGFYSSTLNNFEQMEINLLAEAADDISFGLEKLENESKRKAAENKLIQNKIVLKASQEMAKVSSIEIDLETNKRTWSDEVFRLLGYEPNEVEPSQELYSSHVHPEDADEVTSAYLENFRLRRNSTDEFRIISKDGKVKFISGHLKFTLDENGNPQKLLTTAQDVTKQVAIEEQLKYSEAFNRGVVDSLSSHVAVLDKNGTIVSTNQAWTEFGRQSNTNVLPRLAVNENLFETCDLDLTICDDYTKTAILEMRNVLNGESDFFIMDYVCKHEKEVEWFTLKVFKFDDKTDMIVVVHENNTQTKLAEQERDATLLELEDRVLQRTSELHEINNSFKNSVHYAKRIQLGVLTSPTQLKAIFPKSFLISKACDILSGDFFWCFERNGLKFIVVADCTGHGVPGALMSIIGNALLNRIIKEDESMINPSKILSKLDNMLVNALTGDDERKVMDGMDIAICVINPSEKSFEFAGALRPLFLLETDGTMLQIQGSRSCIGREYGLQSKLFENHTFNYKTGQTLYLCSDGFSSQFGGEKGKKLMTRGLKSILQSMVGVPIKNQRKLLTDIFNTWQGDQAQVDDVILVGIELE